MSFATFVGAVFGALVLSDMDRDWLGLFLAFAAGTFLYIMSSTVFRELPVRVRVGCVDACTDGCAAGHMAVSSVHSCRLFDCADLSSNCTWVIWG